MDLLPPPHERPWLLEQLADLLEKAGRERFLRGPLLEPADQPGEEPEALLSWLTRHVDPEDPPLALRETEDAIPTDPEPAAQLVASAWRAAANIEEADPDLEALLVDLSAVYLGLGLLLLATPLEPPSNVVELGAARRKPRGRLSPQARAFLLGAQLVLRDHGPRERARLLGQLPREARDMALAAVDDLSRPGRLDELREAEAPAMGKLVRLPVPARTVRRVESSQLLVGLGKGLVLGAILGFFSLRIFGPLSAILFFTAGGAVGASMGRNTRAAYCSGCGSTLSDNDAVCPSCDGLVRDR